MGFGIRLPQNPGIGNLDELTGAEEAFVQNIAGLSYAQGDILYHDGSDINNLAKGTASQHLLMNAGATAPEWTTIGIGGGDLLADGTVPLTANWDVGAFTITALTFVSDQATGTAPFTVASTTEVANLKAATAGNADTVTTNANLTGHVTSTGNAAVLGSFTVAQLSTALSDATISGNNSGDEVAADLTTAGIIEIATGAETNTGTDATRAVSPDGLDDWTGSAQFTTTGVLGSGSIASGFGNIDTGSSTITTTGAVSTGALSVTTGDLTIGTTSANDVQPSLKIIGDADSDAGGDTDDTLELTLTPNATPTLATWDFTSTQSAGYTFDKNIIFAANDILLGTAAGDKASILLNDAALSDESWSGTTVKATAGATIAVGDICYLNTAASEWLLNDGILDGTDSGFKLKLGICVLASTDGNPTEILLDGVIASAAFPAFTVGAPVYLDDAAGNLVVAQPSTTNFAIRVIGEAVSATVLHFHPSNDYIVHV